MRGPVSRRAFLLGLGGGIASAGLVWGLSRSSLWPRSTPEPYPLPEGYVDYAGWMVTKADKDKLMASDSMKRLEGSMFDGHDIANRVVSSVDECSSWCLSEPDCQGFSYA